MSDLDQTDAIIWTLRKDARTATATMRVIRNFGVELRVLYNDSLRVARLYGDETAVLADASERRRELESRGWSPVLPMTDGTPPGRLPSVTRSSLVN